MDIDEIVEYERLAIPNVCFEHSHIDSGIPNLVIGVADVTEELDSGLFKVGQITAVVHNAHRVGLGEPDAKTMPVGVVGGVGRRVGPDAHVTNLVGCMDDDGWVTPAVRRLESLGIMHRVLEYEHSDARSDFGVEAAEILGIDPDRVFKTLVVLADGAEACAVVPVSGRLATKAMAAVLGVRKVEMCPPDRAERITGYVVGGISPIAQKRTLPTVIDETAQLFDEVCVSGGRRGMDLGLHPQDLVVVTDGRFADIARL